MQRKLVHVRRDRMQFSLAALLEYTTLCCILSAWSRATGVAASVCLMAMALALGARQGLLALAMLMAASLSADWQFTPLDGGSLLRQLTVILLTCGVCGWYWLRGKVF
jgi:hypothetical protein